MIDWILTNEAPIRLSCFLGVLAVMGVLETWRPARSYQDTRLRHWINNLSLVMVNTLLLRGLALVVPALAVGVAALASNYEFGLLNWLGVDGTIGIVLAILLLDFLIWAQHLVMHHVPVLWRLHRVHHADPDFDVTTALRFHPLEIIFSMALKMVLVAILGVSPVSVVLFEILLNAGAMFNHSNIRIPRQIECILRKIVVTPDFHRVHHSNIETETNSNYGFFLTIWDHLFGTFIESPSKGHKKMTIGLGVYGTMKRQNLLWMLALPFRK